MPTHLGKLILNLRESRANHEGGHMQYNNFIREELNQMESREQFYDFFVDLHSRLRGKGNELPWK